MKVSSVICMKKQKIETTEPYIVIKVWELIISTIIVIQSLQESYI
jgi:hypothetical protein